MITLRLTVTPGGGLHGLEMHLSSMSKATLDFAPDAVIIDPVSSFLTDNEFSAATQMAVRLIDMLKARGITALFTSLSAADGTVVNEDGSVPAVLHQWDRHAELAGRIERT